jgi:hypothetical protein
LFSSNGYLRSGKGAQGQSKAGISTLWIALLLVALNEPNSRPWKPDLNDKTDRAGLPGDWLSIEESISDDVGSDESPLSRCLYAMNANLNAFSIHQRLQSDSAREE